MLVGQQIGPFDVEKELGSGAMGTVYRAKFRKSEDKVATVALKVVALGLLGNEGAMARFEREANILKQLRHPNIVKLLATGRWKGTPFIAMEYIDGEALDRVLARRGRLGWEEVAGYGKQLCTALQYAHEKGIIHRDLKPSNLMITRDGTLKLTDFGIAKDTDVTALTGMNSTIGTAAYMSPEQCKGDRNLTNKSDLYSLGIVFFELLSGKKPFAADSTVDMFLKHVNERPPRVGKIVQDLPPKFEALILQLLEKDKEDRPTDAAWVARMLAEVEDDASARKSAGLEAATARKGGRPRTPDAAPVSEEDREAARALRGVTGTKKKKKKAAEVPLFQQPWFKATAIVLVLAGMAVGAYIATRPPSADKLFAPVEEITEKLRKKERVPADAKVEAAERYLKAHGTTAGERTDAAAALFRAGKVQEREGQLAKRFGVPKWRDDPEGDDPEAYRFAVLAIQAEKDGQLKTARDFWERVKGRFPDEAKLPYTFDEEVLKKARWGWVADKRIEDIKAAQVKGSEIAKKIDENRRFETPAAFDPTSPESLALKATRLQRFQDNEKAARLWDSAVALAEKDPDLHVWLLFASERRTAVPKVGADAAARDRTPKVQKEANEAAELYRKLKAGGPSTERIAWIGLRNQCRELVELYDDETDPVITEAVKKAKGVLADAAKE